MRLDNYINNYYIIIIIRFILLKLLALLHEIKNLRTVYEGEIRDTISHKR